MTDYTPLEGGLEILVGFVAVVLTGILVWRTASFDLTARSRLLTILERNSDSYRSFTDLTDGTAMLKSSRLARWAWLFVRGVGAALFILVFGSIFGVVSPIEWIVALGACAVAMVSLGGFALASTGFASRLEGLSRRFASSEWSWTDRATVLGFWVSSGLLSFTYVVAFASFVGCSFATIDRGAPAMDQFYWAIVLVVDLGLLAFWVFLIAPYRRAAEARLFSACRIQRSVARVLVRPYYAGVGPVVREGQLWEIGDDCVVQGPEGEKYVMFWRRLELLVALPVGSWAHDDTDS